MFNKTEYQRNWRRLNPDKVRENNRLYALRHPDRRIKHRGKWLTTKNARIGVCNFCRNISGIDCAHTQWHHDENRYDVTDISKNTIELCPRCHAKESGLGVTILGKVI